MLDDMVTKTPPEAQPRHDTDVDISASMSQWYDKPKGYIIHQLQKLGARFAKSNFMKRTKDALTDMLLNMSFTLIAYFTLYHCLCLSFYRLYKIQGRSVLGQPWGANSRSELLICPAGVQGQGPLLS